MANMNHCPACSQHYYLHENACPHCGVAAPGGRGGRFVRRARVGGLMLFTALTTTACYGSPPPPGTMPRPVKTTLEQPVSKLPTTVGTAFVFVTPKGEAKQAVSLKLATATLAGTTLTLKEAAAGSGQAPKDAFVAVIEAAAAAAFVAPPQDEPFASLPVEQMKRLELVGTYKDVSGIKAPLEVKLPGATPAQGNLQLARLDEEAIGGVLRVDHADMLIEVYFLAAR